MVRMNLFIGDSWTEAAETQVNVLGDQTNDSWGGAADSNWYIPSQGICKLEAASGYLDLRFSPADHGSNEVGFGYIASKSHYGTAFWESPIMAYSGTNLSGFRYAASTCQGFWGNGSAAVGTDPDTSGRVTSLWNNAANSGAIYHDTIGGGVCVPTTPTRTEHFYALAANNTGSQGWPMTVPFKMGAYYFWKGTWTSAQRIAIDTAMADFSEAVERTEPAQ